MARNNELKQRATQAILAHAFFRLESALTIALTMVLVVLIPQPFPWWQWWYWLVLGVAGEALIIYTSVTDEMTGRKVVSDMLRQQFNPAEIRSAEYRQRVEKALEYRQQIEEHARLTAKGLLRDHLMDTTGGVADWVSSVFGLAKRLDRYESDSMLQRDQRDLPKEIATLRLKWQHEDSDAVKQELQQAITAKENQLINLQKLQNAMEKAEYQLETTLTALGTVYSQILLIGAKDVDSGRARRLREDISDQVAALQSLQSTLDEVYGQPA